MSIIRRITDPLPDYPSPIEMAGNLAAAVARWTAAGFPVAPRDVMIEREATCGDCDEMLNGRCKLCGCDCLKKAWLATERCPAGKWKR